MEKVILSLTKIWQCIFIFSFIFICACPPVPHNFIVKSIVTPSSKLIYLRTSYPYNHQTIDFVSPTCCILPYFFVISFFSPVCLFCACRLFFIFYSYSHATIFWAEQNGADPKDNEAAEQLSTAKVQGHGPSAPRGSLGKGRRTNGHSWRAALPPVHPQVEPLKTER